MNAHPLPHLPPVTPRLLDLDASIDAGIRCNFRAFAHETARHDAQRAGAQILRRVTGQKFAVTLLEDPDA